MVSPKKNEDRSAQKETQLPAVKVEHKSTDRKQAAQPRFFTVAEDNTLLAVYKKYRGKKDYSVEKVAEEAHGKLPDRSRASLEERVNTFFVGITKSDEEKISKASTVN